MEAASMSKSQPKSSSRLDNIKNKIRKSKQLYLFVLPAFLIILIFSYGPMYGVIIAFKDYMPSLGILGSPWVGFKHFQRFFDSYYFYLLSPPLASFFFFSSFGPHPSLPSFPTPRSSKKQMRRQQELQGRV